MDDLALRLGLVGGAVAAALVIAWYLHRRDRGSGRPVVDARLPPGFHYFSSRTCDTCRSARSTLDRLLGAGGYTEHEWERDPEVFQRIGVDEVPAMVVVGEDGSARLYSGRLESALESR